MTKSFCVCVNDAVLFGIIFVSFGPVARNPTYGVAHICVYVKDAALFGIIFLVLDPLQEARHMVLLICVCFFCQRSNLLYRIYVPFLSHMSSAWLYALIIFSA